MSNDYGKLTADGDMILPPETAYERHHARTVQMVVVRIGSSEQTLIPDEARDLVAAVQNVLDQVQNMAIGAGLPPPSVLLLDLSVPDAINIGSIG